MFAAVCSVPQSTAASDGPGLGCAWLGAPAAESRDVLDRLLLHHSSPQTVKLSLKVSCMFYLQRETVKRDASGFYWIQLVLFFTIL